MVKQAVLLSMVIEFSITYGIMGVCCRQVGHDTVLLAREPGHIKLTIS